MNRRVLKRCGVLSFVVLLAVAKTAGLCDAADVVSHRVTAGLDPAQAWIAVIDTATVRIAPDERDGAVHFLLNESVELVRVAAAGLELRWTALDSAQPAMLWDDPDSALVDACSEARQIVLEIGEAWPDSVTFVFAYEGAIYDSLDPPTSVGPGVMQSTTGLIDAAGAFLSWSSFWIPTFGDDLFTFDLSVELPPGWAAVSQGALVGDDGPESERSRGRWRWRTDERMEEIYLIAGPYHVRDVRDGPVAIMTFTYEDDPELTSTYIEAAGRYIEMYSELIGPYPYPKFALVENFWQTGYGMPSFTLLGSKVIRLPFIVHTSFGHEILHNWWGNGVYIDIDEGNWCEGLTTYGADYFYKELESTAAAIEYRQGVLSNYLDYVRDDRDFPLTSFRYRDSAWTQAVGYGKATMVFHMLRAMLGDDLYRAGLRRFYEKWLFKSAKWSDCIASFEAVSGTDLGWFFEQWIMREGAPFLELGEVSLSEDDGAFKLETTIRQRSPAYRLTVPVRVETADGDTTWPVAIGDTLTSVEAVLGSRPLRLAVDPDFDVMRRLSPSEVPLVQARVFGADSTVVFIGSAGSDSLAESYRAAASALGRRSNARIVEGAEAWRGEAPPWCAAWVLGQTPADGFITDLLASDLRISPSEWEVRGKIVEPTGHTLAVAVQSPYETACAWVWVLSGDPASLPAAVRKLPMYGSYSYVLFEGTRVVAKGRWAPEGSPLVAELDGRHEGPGGRDSPAEGALPHGR